MDGRAANEVEWLREVLSRFTSALERHRDELNSLNVFPVPDGDTGSNLLLTMRGVMEGVDRVGDAPAEEFASAVADAALMAARGNSGVMLAQVLRSLAGSLSAPAPDSGPGSASIAADGSDGSNSTALVAALSDAAAGARRAVARPVEGTMLTVLADAASAATATAARGPSSFAAVAVAARDAGVESVERTTALLPELEAAGVVDAGGLGAALLLDALASVAEGSAMTVAVGPGGPVGSARVADQDVGFKFEVMYLLHADAEPADLGDRLGDLGDSVVVVGGGGLFRVHVHTDDPDAALAAAGGPVSDVRIVDLEEQVAEQCVAGQARGVRVGERQATGLVAIVDGDGLARLFRSLGAIVVRGGPEGGPPAVDAVVEAVEASPAPAVIVLPNDPAALAVVERATGESRADIWVVGSRTIPEGLSAAAAFNPTATAPETAERMAEAMAAVTTVLVRRSPGDAGDEAAGVAWVGVSDGPVAADVGGSDPFEVALEVLSLVRTDEHEVLTILAGAGVEDAESRALADRLEERGLDLQIELFRGDQPGGGYILGLE